jgi:hypothetical protein
MYGPPPVYPQSHVSRNHSACLPQPSHHHSQQHVCPPPIYPEPFSYSHYQNFSPPRKRAVCWIQNSQTETILIIALIALAIIAISTTAAVL